MWYVIHTMSGQEQHCLEQCKRYFSPEDYQEIFVPQYIAQKHFQKEWHEVRKTLFPGYLFVDTEHIEPVLEGLHKVYQYTKVLRDGETISPITREEQKFLEELMDETHTVRYSEGFLIGNEVVITKGPLRNVEGTIRSIDRHRRVAKMDVLIFGRMTSMEVGFGAIARVSRDEFDELIQKNKQKSESVSTPETVHILSGVFTGMTGKLLSTDPEKDEWTVEINLFGTGTEVVFRKEEIMPGDWRN